MSCPLAPFSMALYFFWSKVVMVSPRVGTLSPCSRLNSLLRSLSCCSSFLVICSFLPFSKFTEFTMKWLCICPLSTWVAITTSCPLNFSLFSMNFLPISWACLGVTLSLGLKLCTKWAYCLPSVLPHCSFVAFISSMAVLGLQSFPDIRRSSVFSSLVT